MKLFLDFDDFFFNTENGLVPDFFQLLARVSGLEMQDILDAYGNFTGAAYAHGEPYSLERHVEYMRGIGDFDERPVLEAAYAFHADVRRYCFPDAVPFLQKLRKNDVALLTYGAESFQNLKIDGSGLRPFFRSAIIVQGSKVEEIVRIAEREKFGATEKIIFGDNRCKYFIGARERGIITVHLKRPSDRFNAEGCYGCDYRVETLADFQDILEELKKEQ